MSKHILESGAKTVCHIVFMRRILATIFPPSKSLKLFREIKLVDKKLRLMFIQSMNNQILVLPLKLFLKRLLKFKKRGNE